MTAEGRNTWPRRPQKKDLSLSGDSVIHSCEFSVWWPERPWCIRDDYDFKSNLMSHEDCLKRFHRASMFSCTKREGSTTCNDVTKGTKTLWNKTSKPREKLNNSSKELAASRKCLLKYCWFNNASQRDLLASPCKLRCPPTVDLLISQRNRRGLCVA